MEYRELKNLFAVVFERPTNSNNKEWIHKRLKDHFAAHGDPRPELAAGPDAPPGAAPSPLGKRIPRTARARETPGVLVRAARPRPRVLTIDAWTAYRYA